MPMPILQNISLNLTSLTGHLLEELGRTNFWTTQKFSKLELEGKYFCKKKKILAVVFMIPKLGLVFDDFPSFSDDRNELGMTSITRN